MVRVKEGKELKRKKKRPRSRVRVKDSGGEGGSQKRLQEKPLGRRNMEEKSQTHQTGSWTRRRFALSSNVTGRWSA